MGEESGKSRARPVLQSAPQFKGPYDCHLRTVPMCRLTLVAFYRHRLRLFGRLSCFVVLISRFPPVEELPVGDVFQLYRSKPRPQSIRRFISLSISIYLFLSVSFFVSVSLRLSVSVVPFFSFERSLSDTHPRKERLVA